MAGEENIGGLNVSMRVSTEDILPGMAAVNASLTALETKLGQTGNIAATATTKIDAGMKSAAKGSSGFGYQLQLLGQGLDDLQYVGEMGLRPIINNLMQIHPAVGIVAIAIDQARKNGDGWVESMGNVFSAFMEVAGVEFDMSQGVGEFDSLVAAANKFVNYVKNEVPKAWGEISGSTQRGMEAEVAAFLGSGSKEDKARGQGIADAIAGYGHDRFLADMIDPALMAGNNPDLLVQEQKSLIDLVKKAKGGNRAAADELVARTTGTPVGAQIWASLPETKEWKKEDAARSKADAKKEVDDWNAWVGDQTEDDVRQYETPAEIKAAREKLDKGMAANVSGFLKDDAERAKLEERGSDLQYRLANLMNQDRRVSTMGGDAYSASFHGTDSMKDLINLQHQANELMEEIAANTQKQDALGLTTRAR